MPITPINVGTTANDGTGDTLRSAGQTVNEIITAVEAIPAVIDEDDMVSDSAIRPPSQQSVKAHVATAVGAIPAVIDEDDMVSDSAIRPPSQQSVKAYVDASGGGTSTPTDDVFRILDNGDNTKKIAFEASGITTGTTRTFTVPNFDGTLSTVAGTETLTNKTLTSPVLNTGVSGTAVLDEDNMASNSATKLASQQSIKAYSDGARVTTLAALKSLAAAAYTSVFMEGRLSAGDGAEGLWVWRTGDQSSAITNDPAGILWAAPSSDDTGASGAWMREGAYTTPINIFWAGAKNTAAVANSVFANLTAAQVVYPHAISNTLDTLDWLATQAVIDAYPGRVVYMPARTGIYYWNRRIQMNDSNTILRGDGRGCTLIYSTASDGGIYVGPVDPEATVNVSYMGLEKFRLICNITNPDCEGIVMKQAYSSWVKDVNLYGFPRSILNSGGIGNFYDTIDARADSADVPPSSSYSIRFEASDRTLNGYQHSFSHEVSNGYFSGEGVIETAIEIAMADGLHFSNCYIKGGATASVKFAPDPSDYSISATFSNCYLDGQSGTTDYGVYIPAFNESGQTILQVTFVGGIIANNDGGNNVKIDAPTAGAIEHIDFVGVHFGNCLGASIVVTDTAKTVNLTIDGGTTRGAGGGFDINSIGSLIVNGHTFEWVRDDSGIALIDLSGAVDAAKVVNCHTTQLGTGAAAFLSNLATITSPGLILSDNTDRSGARDLLFEKMTIADDSVGSIAVNLTAGEFAMYQINSYAGDGYGVLRIRYDGTTSLLGGGFNVLNNTLLAGTTGTDAKVTASYYTSTGLLYIENRTGASLTIEYKAIG